MLHMDVNTNCADECSIAEVYANSSFPVPKTTTRSKLKPYTDIIPSVLMMTRTIQEVESGKPLKVLLDSGGTHTMIHSSCLPKGATPHPLQDGARTLRTIAGDFMTTRTVDIKDLVFPEFDKTKRVNAFVGSVKIHVRVTDRPCTSKAE